MKLIKTVKDKTPKIGKHVYLADNCVVIGDVFIGDYSSIWFSSVIRGDVNPIIIGEKVNIQDGVVIHCTYQKSKTIIGNNVSIGHNAIIHGCTINDNVLVGMGAIIMDNVEIGKNSVIAAGSVVLEGTIITSGSVYAGVPAKIIKKDNQVKNHKLSESLAENYIMYSSWYKKN